MEMEAKRGEGTRNVGRRRPHSPAWNSLDEETRMAIRAYSYSKRHGDPRMRACYAYVIATRISTLVLLPESCEVDVLIAAWLRARADRFEARGRRASRARMNETTHVAMVAAIAVADLIVLRFEEDIAEWN